MNEIHPADCVCRVCWLQRHYGDHPDRSRGDITIGGAIGRGTFYGLVIFVALVLILVIFGPIVYHTWYVDTHCTMVLGTQVCR